MSLGPLLLLAAIAMIAFAIVATARTVGTFLDVTWTTWLCASFLAWLVSHIVGARKVPA